MRKNAKLAFVAASVVAASVAVAASIVASPAMAKAKRPSLSAKKATLTEGKSKTLKVRNAGKAKVAWSTSDASVAKVSGKGKVTAVKAGKATVTAKVGTRTLKCAVTVKAKPKKPSLSAGSLKIAKGKTTKLSVRDAGKKKFSWSSSNKKVAKVSKNGVVTALKPGKATITAKNGKTKLKCSVTVTKADVRSQISDVRTTTPIVAPETQPQTKAPQTKAPET